MQVVIFETPHPRVIVASHERSGTHFLMNSMAAAFGYQSKRWIDFSRAGVNINYHASEAVAMFLEKFRGSYPSEMVKTHHSFDFFEDVIGRILEDWVILYVHRDPVGVLKSFRRLLYRLRWREGPLVATDAEFLRAEPMGQLMRYQMYQIPTMADRWAAHVKGWLAAAHQWDRIIPVAFESLDEDYESTIVSLGRTLNLQPMNTQKPSRQTAVIHGIGPKHPHYDGKGFSAEDLEYLQDLATRAAGRPPKKA